MRTAVLLPLRVIPICVLDAQERSLVQDDFVHAEAWHVGHRPLTESRPSQTVTEPSFHR
jgi:hypothetical protein